MTAPGCRSGRYRRRPGRYPLDMPIREQLRDRLQEELERQGVTPYRLAKDLNISNASIYEFLNGKPEMSLERLERIFDHLGLELRVDVVVK